MTLPIQLAFLLSGCVVADPGDRLVVVDQGTTRFEIVVGSDAFETTKLAAAELRKYVRLATGVRLPISHAPTADRHHIYISNTESLHPHGFAIQAHGGHLFLRGRDSAGGGRTVDYLEPVHRGTCNAVYEFLERFVGVRWFWSDPLGQIVPRTTRIAVPGDLVIKQEPFFDYRALAYGPPGSRNGDWARRNRLGAAYTMHHAHALHRIVPVDEWARRGHPEYAAMRAGTRRTEPARGASGGHVCTGNPDVVRIVAESAVRFFNTHPARTMYSIAPPDGSGVCTDDLCTRYDVPGYKVAKGVHKGWPVITDRMLHFYNSVAEIVAREHPDRLLGGTIYMDYLDPPRRVKKVRPNVMLLVAPNKALHAWDDDVFHDLRNLYTTWGRFHDRVYAHDTFYLSLDTLALPTPMGDRTPELIRILADSGIRGAYLYVGPTWETLGADTYLLSRLLWNPSCNVAKITREYYGLLYQESASDVRAYFETAADCWRATTLADGADVRRLVGAFHQSKAYARESLAKLLIGYEPRISRLEEHVRSAERHATGDDAVRRRLARLRDNLTLTVTTIEGLRAVVDYEASPNPDSLARLRRAIDAREALLQRVGKSYAPELKKRLHAADKNYGSPLQFGGTYRKRTTSAPTP